MNITLALDERPAERAREAAQAMGKSLNQVIREYLERLAGEGQREALADKYVRSVMSSPGRLNGWKFEREEINDRGNRS